MTKEEFGRLAERMSRGPVTAVAGQRHVYLWLGSLAGLRSVLPGGLAAVLDMYDLAGKMERTPRGAKPAQRLLLDGIDGWLGEQRPGPEQRQIVVVTGCLLLKRYNVPLARLVQAASDTRMVVFVISPQERPAHLRQLPDYVLVDNTATLEYVRVAAGQECVIGETGQ